MAESEPLSDKEKADLVAFLDGELSGERANALEAKLSLDPQARSEADTLKRAWDLLDYLPRAEPSPAFTHRTLERLEPIAGSLSGETEPRPRRLWRVGLFGLGWVASLLLATAVGYGGYVWLVPNGPTEEDLVHDLRLIENKPVYEAIGDIRFLEKLDEDRVFEDDPGL